MKSILVPAVLLLSFANQDFATAALPHRPTETTLTTTVKIPVPLAEKQSGWVLAPTGTVVTIKHVRLHKLLIDLADKQVWINRSNTDFDKRLAAFDASKQTLPPQARTAQEKAEMQKQKANAADFQRKHASYDDPLHTGNGNPLNKGAYNQTRSVVDYYNWLGRRYHIGVNGQRIYQ